MKITFEGSLAEFRAIFRSTSEARSEVRPSSPPGVEQAPASPEISWEYPKDTHFPDTLPPHYGAHSFTAEPHEKQESVPSAPAQSSAVSYSPDMRKKAWMFFVDTVRQWLVGFEDESADQPDRVQLIRELGSGTFPLVILTMIHEIGSLQRFVQIALRELEVPQWTDLDFVERLAAHFIPVSHAGFPDLGGVYDFSTRWRRIEPNWRTP